MCLIGHSYDKLKLNVDQGLALALSPTTRPKRLSETEGINWFWVKITT